MCERCGKSGSSNRIRTQTRGRTTSEITPGLLPQATEIVCFLPKLEKARWWQACGDEMMNLTLDMPCGYSENIPGFRDGLQFLHHVVAFVSHSLPEQSM